MRTFILPPEFNGEHEFKLSAKDTHYLTRVLRMKEGSAFAGRDRKGNGWNLSIILHKQDVCIIGCQQAGPSFTSALEALTAYNLKLREILVYSGLCKGKIFDQIIRQATEIGATRIVPLETEHAVVTLAEKDLSSVHAKTARWNTIVKEALQQCGSQVPTEISTPMAIDGMISEWGNKGPVLVFHEAPIARQTPLFEVLHNLPPSLPIALVIGPEGGFSPNEIDRFMSQGFNSILLKTNILRSETAAIYALSVVQSYLEEFRDE